MKKQTKTRILSTVLSVLLLTTMIVGVCVEAAGDVAAEAYIGLFDGKLNHDISKYFSNAIVALPNTVKDDQIISLIIEVDAESLLDAYEASDKTMSISEFAKSDEAAALRENIAKENAELIEKLDKAGYSYELGLDYDTVLAGFELLITARDFEGVCKTLGNKTNVIVGDVYKSMENKLVENTVNVQDTGIFNSVGCGYDGSGTVVAVLDTGLDYYHTAFSTENFTSDTLGMTFADVEGFIGDTVASDKQAGLTASDVYISTKVPYGFDYADGDADVFPIHSDHGTHVAGVIAGKDDVITGVAPNAQLAIMKIFSDIEDTARTSWILGALEDCVALEVDVINMSIGTSAGFSREGDKEKVTGVYDRIRELGISMVVAASNSFTSTYGSEKNGNLGLTSNPDNGTVGSPSTYKGALSVASVNGAKTPYMLYGESIIYYIEATDRVSEEKEFVADLLGEGVNEAEYEFVTIPGAGRSADYTGIDVSGKIVLVSRGSTTFEEKVQVAGSKSAAGIIIYNNVAGDIKMTVGDAKLAVCSISQDEGEMLAAVGTGKLKISRGQTSGPFMSDFSSWGPSPDLEIKPEITAHGGMILSSVPGQAYDRISGTSMACPNVSGLVAILRQYVRENFPAIADNNVEIAAVVNRLLMSTADIVINKNGLPYAVRKQGAGLANLTSAIATDAYILTKSRKDGSILDKSKIELGDDPAKTGVYTLNFSVYNFGSSSLSYDISAYVMTEGISDTKTNDGKYTVDEQGYLLENGTTVEITNVSGGTLSGKNLTVAAGATADVTITVTVSDADKEYLSRFENGMYIEGHVTLTATAGTEIDLSVPYLAFYGDWTKAPLFDIDYFETNADELDKSIDLADKTLPDAYATRPVGSLYDDYVSFLGGYYFEQNPASKLIAADRKYISISNVEGTVHALQYVWAGMLRSAARVEITITNDATGEVVFEKTENDIRKSYGDGGSIYPANIEIGFDAYEQELENNTRYTVTLKGFLDYGDGGEANNLSNTFTFPLYVDFSAPAVTDVEYYTEYDRSAEKTRLFAKVAVYDNHYSMGAQFGYVANDGNGEFVFKAFDRYITSIYSDFNSTSYVVYELTDYVSQIKQDAANANTFTVVTYDYALNTATYEISLPDEYVDMYFEEGSISLSPNQTYDLRPILYPGSEWSELLEYYSTNMNVADIVGNKVIALKPGVTRIVARDPVTKKTAHLALTVLGEGDEGFQKFDKPVTDNFVLTGYYTKKAYYQLDSTERDIGADGDERKFVGENYSLSMFPSESVILRYQLEAFFPKDTKVVFESSNENIVKVDENGTITAMAEGFASISVNVEMDGKATYYSKSISVEVKEPWITSGPSLSHYFGLGGTVTFPDTLAITEIGQYAFSNFDYVPKTEEDEISEEVPETTKMWYLGDNTIEEVIIPEGVEKIGRFAFANLTALRRVVLPPTLTTIDYGAFAGCVSLVSVEGIGNVKFINEKAFMDCNISGAITLTEGVA
ncbi:MAG: S8 family serine peptidase, partial [Clostridia bacterium]|nr:S8 family serine peptidase [Clostridia bacterium]